MVIRAVSGVALVAALLLAGGVARAQNIQIGVGEANDTPLVLGSTVRVSTSDRLASLESSAPAVIALVARNGLISLEARSPGQAAIRARVNGVVVEEVVLEVQAPDEVWWSIGTVAMSRGPMQLALLENDGVRLWAACVANGRILRGFPPDLAWVVGEESFPADGYTFPLFENAGAGASLGAHETSFTSSAWTLPGPDLEVVSADEVTVSFVTERLPQRQSHVWLVLTRADGSLVQGGRISTPTGFGLPSATESPPGYSFRRDADARTTFTFLVGGVAHDVEVAGTQQWLLEGVPPSDDGCSAVTASRRTGPVSSSLALGIAALLVSRRRRS